VTEVAHHNTRVVFNHPSTETLNSPVVKERAQQYEPIKTQKPKEVARSSAKAIKPERIAEPLKPELARSEPEMVEKIKEAQQQDTSPPVVKADQRVPAISELMAENELRQYKALILTQQVNAVLKVR